MRAPAENEIRARAVELGLGGGEERRRRTRGPPTPRRRPGAGRAGSPPTPPPARRGGRRGPARRRPPRPRGGRCGPRWPCPRPPPPGSPCAPHGQVRPSGSTITWPTCPALPAAPSRSRPSSTTPPPTPVDTTMARKSRLAPGRPAPALAEGQGLGVVVDVDVDAEGAGEAGPEGEVAPRLDVEGRHGLAAGRHRPATAHAAGLLRRRSGPRRRPSRTASSTASASSPRGRRHRGPGDQATAVVDHAGGDLRAADVHRQHRRHRLPNLAGRSTAYP